jgi:hypothetical protein
MGTLYSMPLQRYSILGNVEQSNESLGDIRVLSTQLSFAVRS